jgi:hypothetical protein
MAPATEEYEMASVRWTGPICAFLLTACTAIDVRPVSASENLREVYIERNPAVKVDDFVDVMREGFSRHGIATHVFTGAPKPEFEFILTYTARRKWDLGSYLSHAEVRLERRGEIIASAEYHLRGGGGLSLMKWKGTKAKMDPVLDRFLEAYTGKRPPLAHSGKRPQATLASRASTSAPE